LAAFGSSRLLKSTRGFGLERQRPRSNKTEVLTLKGTDSELL
jgi:hypothetical protein